MKSLFKSALIAGVAIGAIVSTAATAQTVRMGTEGAYPPYNFINDAGDVDGFEREVGDELCKRANLTCEWVVNEWDSIIPNLVSGNYDTIIAGMSITDFRLSPAASAKGTICVSRSRTPQAGSRDFRFSLNAAFDGAISP